MLAYLRLVDNTGDNLSFSRIVNTPRRGLGEKTLGELATLTVTSKRSLFDELVAQQNAPPTRRKLRLTGTACENIFGFIKAIEGARAQVAEGARVDDVLQTLITKIKYEHYLTVLHKDGKSEGRAEGESNAQAHIENVRELVKVASDFDDQRERLLRAKAGDANGRPQPREAQDGAEPGAQGGAQGGAQDGAAEPSTGGAQSGAVRATDIQHQAHASTEIEDNNAADGADPCSSQSGDAGALNVFLNEVSLFSSTDTLATEETLDAVTISTIHAAKGLEWLCVFVPGCGDGIIPSRYALEEKKESKRDSKISEERRLLYVAMTRAKYFLQLSCGSGAPPSRFLQPEAVAKLLRNSRPTDSMIQDTLATVREMAQGKVAPPATLALLPNARSKLQEVRVWGGMEGGKPEQWERPGATS